MTPEWHGSKGMDHIVVGYTSPFFGEGGKTTLCGTTLAGDKTVAPNGRACQRCVKGAQALARGTR